MSPHSGQASGREPSDMAPAARCSPPIPAPRGCWSSHPACPHGDGTLGRISPVQLAHPRSGRSSGGRAGPQCAGGGRRRSNRRRLAPLSPGNPSPSNGGFFTARDEELKVIFSPGCESIGSSIRRPAGCTRGARLHGGSGGIRGASGGLSSLGSPRWHCPQGPPGLGPFCADPRAHSSSSPRV